MRLVTLILSGVLPAAAVAAPVAQGPSWGSESLLLRPAHRVLRLDTAAGQLHASRQPGWQAFLLQHGPGWRARWDERTGAPIRLWGPGWDVDARLLADDAGARTLARQTLDRLSAVLPVPVRALVATTVDRTAGITTVVFEQHHRGLPVDGSRVSIRFKAGRFVMAELDAAPVPATLPVVPQFGGDEATRAALAAFPSPAPATLVVEPPHLVVAHLVAGAPDPRLAYRVRLRALDRPSDRTLWIDALDGTVLSSLEHVRTAAGTLVAEVDDRTPGYGLTTEVLEDVEVSHGADQDTTDGAGAFALPGDAPFDVDFDLETDRIEIDNQDGQSTSFTLSLAAEAAAVTAGPHAGSSTSESNRLRAVLDSFVSVNLAWNHAESIDPGFDWDWGNGQCQVHVNRDDEVCNAWFDGDLNFVRASQDCENSGRIRDVVLHEFGHGFHVFNIINGQGDQGDGSLGEGLADYFSAGITESPQLAPGFFYDAAVPLRDLGPDARWPDDIDADIHITGLIIAGALWDLRQALTADHGADAAAALVDAYLLGIAQRGADIPDSYAEILLVDDDNGNLADGTPNQCVIDEVMAAHGLASGETAGPFAVDHEAPSIALPGAPVPIRVGVEVTNEACAAAELGGVWLRHGSSDDPGDWNESPLTLGVDGSWTGDLSAQQPETIARYQIEIRDTAGDVVQLLPAAGETDPWYEVLVAESTVIVSFDFEGTDGGFVHELLDGGDQEGADDWHRRAPIGGGGDPEASASGDEHWGNDLRPEDNWDGLYQANIHNVLRSPVIEVPAGASTWLQFARWLRVEDGLYDQATVVVDGEVIWENFASSNGGSADRHHEDAEWTTRSFNIGDAAADGAVQVEFHLTSDGGLQLGGWNVDDVTIRSAEAAAGDDDDTSPTGDDDTTTSDDDTAAPEDDDSSPEDSGPALSGEQLVGEGCACNGGGGQGPVAGAAGVLALLLVTRRRGSHRGHRAVRA